MFPQSLSENPCKQSQVDYRLPSCPRRDVDSLPIHAELCLEYSDFQGELNPGVFLCKEESGRALGDSSNHGLVLLIIRKKINVCEM